jgi:Na+-transporting NADH:ubiquinone oxidoreductase subunit NqrD
LCGCAAFLPRAGAVTTQLHTSSPSTYSSYFSTACSSFVVSIVTAPHLTFPSGIYLVVPLVKAPLRL